MIRLAACQYFERTYSEIHDIDNNSRSNIYTIRNDDNDPELWGPHLNLMATVQDFEDLNLEFYLRNYWNKEKKKLTSNISFELVVGSRTYNLGNVYECTFFSRHSTRLSTFVKLTLPQDKYARVSRKTNIEWKIFFGDLILFFVNKFEGKPIVFLIFHILIY